MNSSFATSLLVLGVLGGCTFGEDRIDTAGSHPALGKAEPMTPQAQDAEIDTGRLLVQSLEGYTVYDEAGRKVAHEANHAGDREEDPVGLKLAPGRYFVTLDAPVQEPWKFWVTVERAKVTRVDNNSWSDIPPVVR